MSKNQRIYYDISVVGYGQYSPNSESDIELMFEWMRSNGVRLWSRKWYRVHWTDPMCDKVHGGFKWVRWLKAPKDGWAKDVEIRFYTSAKVPPRIIPSMIRKPNDCR